MTALMAVVVVACAAGIIGYPLWKPGPQLAVDPTGSSARLVELKERKRQIYSGIRELGFDYRMDKLEKDDYDVEIDRLKTEAVGVVAEIETMGSTVPRGADSLEAEIAAFRGGAGSATAGTDGGDGAFCTQCGSPAAGADRFCGACGHELEAAG